jgi:antitoxin (DNA-binding transcriptional repressor) of toxin-antitoxin stability system
MKALTIADIETRFSDVIGEVMNGEKVQILFGTLKEPVAMIVPMQSQNNPRKIGILEGKALFKVNGNSKFTEEEFLGI